MLVGLAALLVVIGGLGFPLDFDEEYHWSTIRHIVDSGFRFDLRTTETATSPLFHVLAAIQQVVTDGGLAGVRLFVVFFGLSSMILLWAAVSRAGIPSPLLFVVLLFLHPEFFRYSKMAMTEIPSFLWVCVAVFLLARPVLSWSTTAMVAVALAAAVWTRQSWIFLIGAVAVTGLSLAFSGERRRSRHFLVAAMAAIVLAAPLFVIWGGSTPPRAYAISHDPGFQAGQVLFGFILCGFYLGIVGIAGPWQQRHVIAVASGVLAAILVPTELLDVWRRGDGLDNPQGPILKLATLAADRFSPRAVHVCLVALSGLGTLSLMRMGEATSQLWLGKVLWIYLGLFSIQVSFIPQVMERYWGPAIPALILLAHLAVRGLHARRWGAFVLGLQLAVLGGLYFLYQEFT